MKEIMFVEGKNASVTVTKILVTTVVARQLLKQLTTYTRLGTKWYSQCKMKMRMSRLDWNRTSTFTITLNSISTMVINGALLNRWFVFAITDNDFSCTQNLLRN